MRAGNIFKFAHMSVFVTSIGVGVFGAAIVTGSAAIAQFVVEFPGDDAPEEFPEVETPEEETPEEEAPEEEMPQEEAPEEEMPQEEAPEEEAPEEETPEEDSPQEEIPQEDRPRAEAPGEPSRNAVQAIKSQTARFVSPPVTASISRDIEAAAEFCDRIIDERRKGDERYLVDCIGERLLAIARAMPRTGEYAQAREILMEAGEELRALARANKSPTAPVGRARGTVGNKVVRTRPLTPVRRESVPAVKRAAAAILQEAETKLLRSAAASDRRLIAYAQIAKAVGSNKKLLRSA